MAQRFYVTSAKNNISSKLGETLKKYAIRFYQLKIRHRAIGNFLAKIKAMKTPQC